MSFYDPFGNESEYTFVIIWADDLGEYEEHFPDAIARDRCIDAHKNGMAHNHEDFVSSFSRPKTRQP